MREWAGDLRWEIGYEQYYLRARLQDGTVCLLQFDYAVPYADPTLRDILPDVQTMHLIWVFSCWWGWSRGAPTVPVRF